MSVIVVGILRFPPDKLDVVRLPLLDLVRATRELDDCIEYNVAEDLFEPGLIRFSEEWPDMASLQAHLEAPHIQPWRQVCQENGLIERRFTAFETHGSVDV